MVRISVLALLALPLACMTACGDDSEDKIFSNGGSSGGGGKSGGGASGKGGSSGSVGVSGSTSTGGGVAAGSGGQPSAGAAGSGGDAGSAGAAEGGTSSGGQSGNAGSAGSTAGQGGTSGSTGAGGVSGSGGAGSGGVSGNAGSGNAGTGGSSAGQAGASGSAGEGGSTAGSAGAGGVAGSAGSGSTAKTVVINEVCSVNPDHLEFRNVTGSPIDISGWYFTDSEPEKDGHTYTFPPGTIINDLLVLYATPSDGQLALKIGLGDSDAVKLYDKSKTLQDQYSWSAHVNAASRCPTESEPVIGEFKIAPASAGEPNKCE